MPRRREGVGYCEGDFPPSNLGKDDVSRYAERVAKALGFKPGGSLQDVIEQKLGGRIHYEPIEDWLSDDHNTIYVHAKWDFDIVLPTFTSPLRDRFTIAHELGHYFLHSNQGEFPLIANRRGSVRTEWEANWFAASLLMPEKPFREACKRDPSVRSLAAEFGVSTQAATVRKKVLGCG